jgi:hypothetical protein
VPNSTPATVAVTWPGQREIDPVEHLSGARSERVVVGRRGDSAQRVVPACGQRGATSSPDNALERTRWRPSWASATAGTPVTSASNGTLGADVPGDSCPGYASRVGGSPPGRGATVRAEEARVARSRGSGEPKANRGSFVRQAPKASAVRETAAAPHPCTSRRCCRGSELSNGSPRRGPGWFGTGLAAIPGRSVRVRGSCRWLG